MQDNSHDDTQNGHSTQPPVPEPVVPSAAAIVDSTTHETNHVVDASTDAATAVTPSPVVVHEETPVSTVVATTPAASRAVMQYVIAGVIVLLMGVGLWYVLEEQGRVNTGVFTTITELVNPGPAAAEVNGVKIPLATYEKNRIQIENNAAAQGLTVTDEAVKAEISKQAIDVLINTELLKQAAAKEGITVTQEQIDTRYQEIIASLGGEDALEAKMVELAITEDSLQSDIKGEILIQSYLSKAVDLSKVTVDEADVKAVYDQANTPGATLPPLAEVKADIEAQLKSTKEQELVNAHIETLRTDAKIETNV